MESTSPMSPTAPYWLEVEVDPDDNLVEADKTNNVARVKIRLRPPQAGADRYEDNDSSTKWNQPPRAPPESPSLSAIESRLAIEGLSMEDERDIFSFRLNDPPDPGGFVRIDSPWSVGDLNLYLYDSSRFSTRGERGSGEFRTDSSRRTGRRPVLSSSSRPVPGRTPNTP
jgi:hypothetical protein